MGDRRGCREPLGHRDIRGRRGVSGGRGLILWWWWLLVEGGGELLLVGMALNLRLTNDRRQGGSLTVGRVGEIWLVVVRVREGRPSLGRRGLVRWCLRRRGLWR